MCFTCLTVNFKFLMITLSSKLSLSKGQNGEQASSSHVVLLGKTHNGIPLS